MEFPENVLAVVKDANNRHRTDIEKAVTTAEQKLRNMPEYPQFVDLLIRQAVMELVYRIRSSENHSIKTMAGAYHTKPRVNVAGSSEVNAAANSVYSLAIAGTVLGALKGADLAGIAESEQAISQGHAFNAMLCRKLSRLVPEQKTVRESVKESKLRALIREVQALLASNPTANAG